MTTFNTPAFNVLEKAYAPTGLRHCLSKKAFAVLALACCAVAAPAWAAGSAAGTFNVGVTLTSKCEITAVNGSTGATITALPIAYTSFQTTASAGTTGFAVRCTKDQAYSLALDSASVTDGVTGLAYTLNLSTANVASSTANATVSGQTGTGLTPIAYFVNANMAAGQDGTVLTTGTANSTRTLTVTY